MTPILRKSKEAGKNITKSSRNFRDRSGNVSSRFIRSRGRGRRLFLTSRSRLASLARAGHLPDHRGSRDHHRYPSWFGRGDSSYSK